LLGALGKDLMPELSKVLAAADSGDVKVVVKRNVRFSLTSHNRESDSAGLMQGDKPEAASLVSAGNAPLMPEANKLWPMVRLVLLALIIAAIFYFLRLR
jgi:hypothetical protein